MTTRPLLAFGLSALLVAPVLAAEAVDLEMVTRIRDEGFTRSQVMDTAAHLTDVIGPRVTGSPQMKEANDWTRARLESWGLANARLEAFPFGRGWSLEKATVQMVAPASASLIALPRAFTPGTDGPRRGKVVKADIESEADIERYRGQLAGRIVLLGRPRAVPDPEKPLFTRYTDEALEEISRYDVAPRRRGPLDRAAIARRVRLQRALRPFFAAEKALATIEPSASDSAGAVLVGRGGSREKGEDPGVPDLVMSAEHHGRIARLLDRGLEVELELDVRARFHDDDPSAYNTLAEIPGTDRRGEVVMIGAHLDSWHGGTGATDNAAGSAVAMEAMRILQALGVMPRRTIRLALWSGEEQGLLGSRAYVAEHFGAREEPVAAQERDLPSFARRDPEGPVRVKPGHAGLAAYFNVDNGTGRIRGIYAERNAAVAPVFEAWLRPLRDLGAATVTLRRTFGTDHIPFDAVGLPAFQFIQDDADYQTRTHHTNLDVYERLKRDDLMQASVVLASFAYHAAMRPERLPRRPLPRPSPSPPPARTTSAEPPPP
ncbi:MAG TPA: M20/M25/M40 family metallo-hydrolase [Vicinamibacteria bacterium]|nr:M20/M25/M40 family metallo-hydrolase [Vicinamibacteria bacterium]